MFASIEEFKKAIVEYVLKEGWNLKYTRWRKEKCEAVCEMEDGFIVFLKSQQKSGW